MAPRNGIINAFSTLINGRNVNLDMVPANDDEVMPEEVDPEIIELQKKREERKRKRIEAWYPQYKEAKDDRAAIEHMWDWCIRALWGQQDLVRDPGKMKLRYDTKVLTGKSRYIFDKLSPIYRQMNSRLMVEYPSVSILPTTNSEDNVIKALVNQEICRFYWFAMNLKDLIMDGIKCCTTTGAGGLHAYYDPAEETVKSRYVTPFDIFWPKSLKRWEDSPWWAVRTVVYRDELIDMFPEYIKEIEEAHEIDTEEYPPDHIEIFDVYWRDGLYCIMLEETPLFEGRYNKKALPIQMFRYTDIPNMVHGVGLIEKLLPYQLLYNRKRNRIVNTLDKMGNPKILVPTQCQVNDQMLEGDSSVVVRYNPMTGKPEYMTGADLPAGVYEDLNRVAVEMEDTSGLHATSMGKVARGVRSARHVEALSSNDDTQLYMTMANVEKAVAAHFKAVLVLMKQHYPDDQAKMIRMFDDNAGFIAHEFFATDIVDDPEIYLESGSLFRSETQDREQRAMDLAAIGFITPQEGREMVDFKTADKAALEKTQAMSHARQILADIIENQGQGMVEIYPFDDLEAFESTFRKFMQSSRFRELTTLPNGIAVMTAIMNTYKQIMAMMMPQMMPQGVPGQPAQIGAGQMGVGVEGGGNMDLPPQSMEEGGAPPPIPNMGMVG